MGQQTTEIKSLLSAANAQINSRQSKLREHELKVKVSKVTAETNPLVFIEVDSLNEYIIRRPHNKITPLAVGNAHLAHDLIIVVVGSLQADLTFQDMETGSTLQRKLEGQTNS